MAHLEIKPVKLQDWISSTIQITGINSEANFHFPGPIIIHILFYPQTYHVALKENCRLTNERKGGS